MIVVGNVIAGGAGKTPTVISIAQHLTAQGLKVSVVSRGYGRKQRDVRGVHVSSTPHEVGDEPLLIFNKAQCPVFVGSNRYDAACAMLKAHPQIDVILCDDGLQHYSFHRNFEVLVFDDRGIGNGWLLPAGPLREPWPRHLVGKSGQTAKACITLHTGKQPAFAGFRAHRSLAPHALSSTGQRVSLDLPAASADKPLFALAGLAQPQAFFDMLAELKVPLAGTLALPDHFDFKSLDPSLNRTYTLLCTEKDAAKLWPIAPQALAVPLVQQIEEGFWQALDAGIGLTRNGPLSSAHGHKTA